MRDIFGRLQLDRIAALERLQAHGLALRLALHRHLKAGAVHAHLFQRCA